MRSASAGSIKMLSDREATARNLELEAEFERHLVEHPELLEKIPEDAHVVLLPQYDTALYEYNFELYRKCIGRAERVVCVKVGSFANMVPPSRLRDVAIEAPAEA